MSDTPQAQAAPAQDPQTAPVAAPPVSAPPVGDGPWANDLNLIFQDPSQRAQVDQFLRTKVQPYTTKLEQEQAQYKDAVRLWQDLEASPVDTYVAITTEMFGDAAGQAVLTALQGVEQQQAQTQQPPAPQQMPTIDPRVEAALQWVEQDQASRAYDAEMARVTAANPGLDETRMHTFVAAAEGDFEKAVALYREDEQRNMALWLSRLTPEQRAAFDASQPPAPQAPPAMGSDTATAQASTTQVEPRKQTLDQAINDWMSEQRAAKQAPPVGSV